MAKIYISSTYEDLKKEREAASKAVRRLGHQPVYMEDYVAGPQQPVDKCLQDVCRCDVYIGIFAWRYGYIPDGYDKSITRLEYEAAKRAGIPCLIFLLDQKAPWSVEHVDGERRNIDQLRKKLKNDHIVSFFKNADELSSKVSAAVRNLNFKEKAKVKARENEVNWKKWGLTAAAIIVLIMMAVFLKNLIEPSDTPGKTPGEKQRTEKQRTEEKTDDPKGREETEFKKLLEQVREGLRNKDFANARKKLKQVEKIKKTKETENIGNEIDDKEFDYHFSKAKDNYINENYNEAQASLAKAKPLKVTNELRVLEKKIAEKLDEKKRLALFAQDDRAWENAAAQNIIPALQAYLGKYPSGRHVSAAKKKIEELEQAKKPGDVKAVEKIAKKVYKNKNDLWEAEYDDGIIMVHIPPGEFTMGSNDGESNEEPPHPVYLDGYWIGKYEVTFSQYDRYCDETGKEKKVDEGWGRGKRPVINVTWDDANAYCQWLSKKTGLKFKLPTEAQWEKAARGTDNRKYPWENHAPYYEGKYYANYDPGNYKEDGFEFTAPVGSFPQGASPYGLLDMAGNVWEWCSDRYKSDYYKDSPKENPTGPNSGTNRVMRGGGWDSYAVGLRCAFRIGGGPSGRFSGVGFRLCQDN